MKGLYEFFLLFSSLSESAPRETKLHYAFKIYDFDQDNFIGTNDIEQAVKLLTQVMNSNFWKKANDMTLQSQLTAEEVQKIVGKVENEFQRYID